MFWTKDKDSLNCFNELTLEHRCKDEFLSHVLQGARHGTQDAETYSFLHGLPTRHAGSWLPSEKKVACGKAACLALTEKWTAEILAGKQHEWYRRRSDECETCATERRRRCRVLGCSDLSPDIDSATFAAAPYIHPFNEPKYHASQVRALRFAATTQSHLLWIIAQDRPLHKKADVLYDGDLGRRQQQWASYHDQKTGGIMGLQPLVKELPLRITQTDHKRKDKSLFKNSRWVLHGWKLHPVDEERFKNLSTMQMVLQHLPEHLYIRKEGATWVEDANLGPGVAELNPQRVVWALDKKWEFKV